jgi:hypothetical protein
MHHLAASGLALLLLLLPWHCQVFPAAAAGPLAAAAAAAAGPASVAAVVKVAACRRPHKAQTAAAA